MPAKQSTFNLVVLAPLLVLAYALRVYALPDKAVWWDEAWSVWAAQQSFGQTTEITAEDVHPPLYEWLLHGWVRVVGITEFAVRYLSVLWGLIAVAAVYPVARRFSSKRAALLATFFIALAIFHIRWSQETRMYAMAAATGILACYAYLRAESRWSGWWILLIAAGAVTALTHYLGAMVLVVLNLHWLLTFRSRRRAFHVRWLIAMVVTGLILLAWIASAISRTRSGGTDTGVAPAFIFELAATLLAVGMSVNVDQYLPLTVIILAGFFGGLLLYSRRNAKFGLLIWLMALVPPGVIFLLSFPNRFYHPAPEERYLLIFAPLLYVGIGIALDQFLRLRWKILGRLAVLALVTIYGIAYLSSVDQRYYRDDYAMLVRTVRLLGAPNEPIFFVSGDRYPLVYYHMNLAAGGYSQQNVAGFPFVDKISAITPIIGTNTRFWVIEIERSLGDPQNLAIPWLDSHYHRLLHIPIDYNGLTLYSTEDGLPPDSSTILPPVIREARPGDIARIGVPAGTQIDLFYRDGKIASQPAAQSWQLAQFPIYPTYPPGDYSLRFGAARYDFHVTHSQPAPNLDGGNITKLDQYIGPFRLFGYSVNTWQLHPGDTLDVTLFWQANAVPTENFTAFVHLLGGFNPATNGPQWAGHDGYPAGTPTTALWSGQFIADKHSLQIAANSPPGSYSVEVGMYTLEDGKRLVFADGSDHVEISGFEVVR